MLQAEKVSDTVNREHAKPIGNNFVKQPVLEQKMMERIMGQASQSVLRRTHPKDRRQRNRYIPPESNPAPSLILEKPAGGADARCEKQVDGPEVKEISVIVGFA